MPTVAQDLQAKKLTYGHSPMLPFPLRMTRYADSLPMLRFQLQQMQRMKSNGTSMANGWRQETRLRFRS